MVASGRLQSAQGRSHRPGRGALAILALSLIGLGISVYLWTAKAGASSLICGPMGDCATVNTSEYSEIWGVPVAAFGTGMYALLALCGGMQVRYPRMGWPRLLGFAMAFAGAIFSLYLTALEAFVIHAYCAWCLVSWVLVTAIAAQWGILLWKASGDGSERSDDPAHE